MATKNDDNVTLIHHMEEFYEKELVPKMLSFPSQYMARIIANHNKKTN